jgi:hypothetical protein
VVICSDRSEIVPVYDSTRATTDDGVAAFVDKGVAGRAVLCSAAAVGLAGAELWCPVANKKKPVPTPILTIRASAMSNNAARLLAAGARDGTLRLEGRVFPLALLANQAMGVQRPVHPPAQVAFALPRLPVQHAVALAVLACFIHLREKKSGCSIPVCVENGFSVGLGNSRSTKGKRFSKQKSPEWF